MMDAGPRVGGPRVAEAGRCARCCLRHSVEALATHRPEACTALHRSGVADPLPSETKHLFLIRIMILVMTT